MILNLTSENHEELQRILNWIEDMVRAGAECSVTVGSPDPQHTPQRDLHQIAKEVYRGEWGNGIDRRTRLTIAGYTPEEIDIIQDIVDDLVYG